MKKSIMIILLLIAAIISFNSCTDDEGCDKEAVRDRIESLEDAINDNDVSLFLENMASDTNQFNTYDQASLNTLTDSGATDYNFHDYEVSCDGEDDADVTCTATITPGGDEPTSFVMLKDGEWYIYLWEEGDPAVTMYDKYSAGQ
ncbi:MAG TPA: hypothetical protein PK573_02670 [Spirochaetota bacterium]|nr:hypothetical protein [Spirochaetota bacterium]HRZ26720.1 hypothetical protein [Spirochaetota bacterium]HSA13483.1 hypothetical protein [Spirochaetota bacterium]